MAQDNLPCIIHTIGHGNATTQVIIDLLLKNQVEVLVDVRSVPYSRFVPDFNSRPLKAALNAAGLKYVFAGEKLGGRPKDPTVYRAGTPPDSDDDVEAEDYIDLVDYTLVAQRAWYQEGLARLTEIAREYPTAIMCSEEDPNHCHRSLLIAKSLVERGVEVRHIRRDGRVHQHYQQLSLF
jgi:uncharacterized protein (DUF488 family)